MTLNLSAPTTEHDLKPRIVVLGVGGAGCNAVNNMIASNLDGVEFVVANTDAQALGQSRAERRIQLGVNITNGLGAGARPDIGRAAAEEALDVIVDHVQGGHMAFIAAGMGGGTGTGAAPVIARAAREHGLLTVGVVTKPFQFEGSHRMSIADEGIEELQNFVDTLIVIPNQNLFRVCTEKTTFAEAFGLADDVLKSGVRGVTDLMVNPGLINLDFADIRTVMSEMGKAMMGTGEAAGEKRAIDAAEAAIANPLLDDVSMQGARGVLINITGGPDMTLFEVDEAANRVREEVDTDAHIIFGSALDEGLEGVMRVSIVATGIEADQAAMPRPTMISLVHDADQAPPAALPEAQPAPLVSANTAPPITAASAVAPVAVASAAPADLATPPPAPTEPALAAEAIAPTVVESADLDPAPAPDARPDADPPFIAAKPVVAQPVGEARVPQAPEPFNEAALANAGQAVKSERRRGRSLFQKVTGAVSGLVGEDPKPTAEPTVAKPAVAEPAPPAAAPPPALAPAPPAAAAKPTQPRLTNLDTPPPSAPSSDDEMLEIPAFLRRQAN